jgi:hypothetical protein
MYLLPKATEEEDSKRITKIKRYLDIKIKAFMCHNGPLKYVMSYRRQSFPHKLHFHVIGNYNQQFCIEIGLVIRTCDKNRKKH